MSTFETRLQWLHVKYSVQVDVAIFQSFLTSLLEKAAKAYAILKAKHSLHAYIGYPLTILSFSKIYL